MRLLIVGAGIAGITATVEALKAGISDITVLEKNDHVGGVWGAGGLAWESMQTNVSRHTVFFTDFPWPEETPDFPTTLQMREYIEAYVEHMGIRHFIQFSSTINTLTQTEDKQWKATWSTQEGETTQIFDHALLATGKFSEPHIPDFPGLTSVEYIHSAKFTSTEDFVGKTVLVIGSSFSGVSIAEALAKDPRIKKVKHLINTPQRLGLKYYSIDPENQGPSLPRDIFFNQAQIEQLSKQPHKRNAILAHLCGDQDCIPAWKIPEGFIPKLTITDGHYLELACADKIETIQDKIDHFEPGKVFLRNSTIIDIDTIIFCTGYHNTAPYLPKPLQQLPDDSFYLKTFPIELSNIACCGMFKQTFAPHTFIVELQAKLAIAHFMGRWLMPESAIIATEKNANEATIFIEQLATALNIHPNQHRESFTARERLLLLGPPTPWQFKLRGPDSDPEQAIEQMQKLIIEICCEKKYGQNNANNKLAYHCLQWLKQEKPNKNEPYRNHFF